jgi:hypothetical protein
LQRLLGIGDTQDRRLDIASALLAGVFIVYLLIKALPGLPDAYSDPAIKTTDFRFLYNAGVIVTSGDAKQLYGPEPDAATWAAEKGYIYSVWYPYPPSVALATGALQPLGRDGAATAWRVLVGLSITVLGLLVAREFRSWPWRLAVFLAIFCWEPLVLNARIGQTGAFIAVATALAMLVFLRNKNLGAILFGLIAVKPTAVIGPSLLIFPEKLGVWGRYAGTAAAIILTPFLYLGFDQFKRWLNVLSTRGADDVGSVGSMHYYNQGITSAFGGAGYLGLVVAILLLIAAAFAVSEVLKRLGPFAGAAFVLAGAAVVNPHNLIYDWGTAFIVVLLLRRSELIPAKYAELALGALAISLFAAGQIAWDVRYSLYTFRPLTMWAVCISLSLLVVAFWDEIKSWTRPDAKTEAILALRDAPAREGDTPSNKARRRRERREAARRQS